MSNFIGILAKENKNKMYKIQRAEKVNLRWPLALFSSNKLLDFVHRLFRKNIPISESNNLTAKN